MIAWLRKFGGDLFTGPKNDNFELVRVMAATGLFAVMTAQFTAIFKGQELDVLNFAGAISAIIAATGAGAAMKDRGAASAISAKGYNDD